MPNSHAVKTAHQMLRSAEIELEESLRDRQFVHQQLLSQIRAMQQEHDFAAKSSATAESNANGIEALWKTGAASRTNLKAAKLKLERANLELMSVSERLKIYESVAEEFGVTGKDAAKSEKPETEPNSDPAATSRPKSSSAAISKQISELELVRIELLERYGSSHPRVKSVDRQLDLLDGGNKLRAFTRPTKRQLTFKGKPFSHWINITKTERSTEMLCDALRAGASLAETEQDKVALLEVTRTLARKHGTAYSNNLEELTQYQEAMFKAINVLAPPEIIQFVLDELEHGTSQSVRFCSALFRNTSIGTRGRNPWSETHDNAFVEQAPKLLKLSVAKIEEGEAEYHSVLKSVVASLIETRQSVASFAVGGKRADVSGVLEKRLSWANEKNPALAPTIRQLFLDSSAATKRQLVQLTRAFWPNDEEIELALQTSLFDPSTDVEVRDALYWMIVGGNVRRGRYEHNDRTTYQDFLGSSPKPIAVQFLKKLLDNQLGPEDQRVIVMDDNRHRDVEGRPATIYYVCLAAKSLMQKHPNDTDEDVTGPIRELLERIVEIENTDNPTLKQELDDFKKLNIFRNATICLAEITREPAPSPNH